MFDATPTEPHGPDRPGGGDGAVPFGGFAAVLAGARELLASAAVADVSPLGGRELLAAITACQDARRVLDATEAHLLAHADTLRTAQRFCGRSLANVMSASCTQNLTWARSRVRRAKRLVEMDPVNDAFSRGKIDTSHVAVFVDDLWANPPYPTPRHRRPPRTGAQRGAVAVPGVARPHHRTHPPVG